MSIYAIGDVQGCFDPLMRLLKQINFDPAQDCLWFTGDLVNRGPQSLETLRFIKSLGNRATTVLGNHDLTLLAVANHALPYHATQHTFADVLQAADRAELIHWLQHQPLIHHDATTGYTLVHAGLYPNWDLTLALSLAKEVEAILQGEAANPFFAKMYDDHPDTWDPQLQGIDRARFIVNCFTRLRFCSADGRLEFATKGSAASPPSGCFPWFAVPGRSNKHLNILFGHWASLEGHCTVPNVFPLDTGCVWGNCLTAMRLEDRKIFKVSCSTDQY